MILENHLVGVVFGIRLRRQFAMEDLTGQFLDLVLYRSGSLFDSDFFPEIGYNPNNPRQRNLRNRTTNDTLRVDSTDIILEVHLRDRNDNLTVQDVERAFHRDVIQGALDPLRIPDIMRLGYIRRYAIPRDLLRSSFPHDILPGIPEDVRDFDVQFTQKTPIPQALVRKNVNDFVHVIYRVGHAQGLDTVTMTVDFQHYYEPYVESAGKLDFPSFATTAVEHNRIHATSWLSSFVKPEGR